MTTRREATRGRRDRPTPGRDRPWRGYAAPRVVRLLVAAQVVTCGAEVVCEARPEPLLAGHLSAVAVVVAPPSSESPQSVVLQ
jgi:hypothetical protein